MGSQASSFILSFWFQTLPLAREMCVNKGEEKDREDKWGPKPQFYSPPLVLHTALVKGDVCYQKRGEKHRRSILSAFIPDLGKHTAFEWGSVSYWGQERRK